MKKENSEIPLWTIGEYILLEVCLSYCYQLLNIDNKAIDNLVFSLISLIILVFALFKTKSKLKGQFEDFKNNWGKYLKTAFKWWAFGFIAMFVSNLIINFAILGGIAPNEEANREMLEVYPFYMVISTCIFAPITEELLFRLNFKESFKGRFKFVFMTSIIFAGMHLLSSTDLASLIYFFPYFALGTGLALAYYDTKNIYSSIAVHIFHNTFTVAVIFLGI